MFCTQCGSANDDSARFCQKCGHPFSSTTPWSAPHSPQSSPSKSKAPSPLWNPTAAAIWSLPFSPAFGSYLQMLNWRSLEKHEEANSARNWFYLSLFMLAVYVLIGLFVADSKSAESAVNGLGFMYLLLWYFTTGRQQGKFVKVTYGSDYPRMPWGKPLLIGIAISVGYVLAFIFVIASLRMSQVPLPVSGTSVPNASSTPNTLSTQRANAPNTSSGVAHKGGISESDAQSLVGFHPYGVSADPNMWFGRKVKESTGNHFSKFVDGLAVSSKIEQSGNYVWATGCQPHLCGSIMSAFAIDLRSGTLITIHFENGTTLVGGAANAKLPADLCPDIKKSPSYQLPNPFFCE